MGQGSNHFLRPGRERGLIWRSARRAAGRQAGEGSTTEDPRWEDWIERDEDMAWKDGRVEEQPDMGGGCGKEGHDNWLGRKM